MTTKKYRQLFADSPVSICEAVYEVETYSEMDSKRLLSDTGSVVPAKMLCKNI